MQVVCLHYVDINILDIKLSDMIVTLDQNRSGARIVWELTQSEYHKVISGCNTDIEISIFDTIQNIIDKHKILVQSITDYINDIVTSRIDAVIGYKLIPGLNQFRLNTIKDILVKEINPEQKILKLCSHPDLKKEIVSKVPSLSEMQLSFLLDRTVSLNRMFYVNFKEYLDKIPVFILAARYYILSSNVDTKQIETDLFRSLCGRLDIKKLYSVVPQDKIDALINSKLPTSHIVGYIKDLIVKHNQHRCSRDKLLSLLREGTKDDRLLILNLKASRNRTDKVLSDAEKIIYAEKNTYNITVWQVLIELSQ